MARTYVRIYPPRVYRLIDNLSRMYRASGQSQYVFIPFNETST